MTTKPTKRVRCAVYTRVSTEYGLDQEFNSLDAQHEAAEAYIRSQAHDGWTLIRGSRFAGLCPWTGLTIANAEAGGHCRTRFDRGGGRRWCCRFPGSHSCGAHVLISNAGLIYGQRAAANIGDGHPNNCDPPRPGAHRAGL